VVLDAVRQDWMRHRKPGRRRWTFDYKSPDGLRVLDIYHGRLPMLIDGGYNWWTHESRTRALLAEQKGRTGESYLLTVLGHIVRCPGYWPVSPADHAGRRADLARVGLLVSLGWARCTDGSEVHPGHHGNQESR